MNTALLSRWLMKEDTLSVARFRTESGKTISDLRLRFQTWGKLNPGKDNVVWVCHALTGNHRVDEWWSGLFGAGKVFDPRAHFIVCVNVPSSCYGSTGPLCFDAKGNRYYRDFPLLTIRDFVAALDLVREHLGINRISVGIGASLGGQQLLEWAVSNPGLFQAIIPIATNAKHSTYGIAWNETQRMAIESDPEFEKGGYSAGKSGMIAARAIAMLSYRSALGYHLAQQESDSQKSNDFKVSSYQRYQGEKLAGRFNAYSYWYLSKAMDSHNLARGRGKLKNVLSRIKARTLVVGISSDILFPVEEQHFLFHHIPDADLLTIQSPYGHDGFLVEYDQLAAGISEFLQFQHEHTKQLA